MAQLSLCLVTGKPVQPNPKAGKAVASPSREPYGDSPLQQAPKTYPKYIRLS